MNIKRISLFSLAVAGGLFMVSCGNNNSEANHNTTEHEHHAEAEHDHSNHEHGGEATEREISANSGELKGDLTQILNAYFEMNNHLVKDDASGAQKSGGQLEQALQSFKATNLSEEEQKEVNEILESAIENAQHIAKSEIDHQREHLVVLSVDLKDLIAIIGAPQKLYEDYCPMVNNNKGGIWISNKEEISNPYMGSSMPKCGKVNRVIE